MARSTAPTSTPSCCSAPAPRGDERPDSDYDIAVFLKHPASLWEELGKLSHITTEIMCDTGAVISAKPFDAGLYAYRSPLMQEIRADGIDL